MPKKQEYAKLNHHRFVIHLLLYRKIYILVLFEVVAIVESMINVRYGYVHCNGANMATHCLTIRVDRCCWISVLSKIMWRATNSSDKIAIKANISYINYILQYYAIHFLPKFVLQDLPLTIYSTSLAYC